MGDIRKLLGQMAKQEEEFQKVPFLAPCVRGGTVRAKVAGLVLTLAPRPNDFEGWGIFQAADSKTAQVVEEASLPLIAEYLELFPALRLRLARALAGQTWLAYPANEGDMRQRWGTARPVAVHLVAESAVFEQVTARCVGGAWWFEDVDRRADPLAAEQLRDALRNITPPDQVRFQGVTPEMRTVYDLVAQQDERFVERRRAEAQRQWREDQRRRHSEGARARERRQRPEDTRDEARLRGALRTGGGELRDFTDRGEYWLVEWTTRDGERHTSAIAKGDLTVISSGICLSDRDRDFDLQSLVGVIERRYEDDWR